MIKQTRWLGLGTFLLLLATPASTVAAGYWQPVSQADSIQLIRNFEGDQALPLVVQPDRGALQKIDSSHYHYTLESFSTDYFWRLDNCWLNNRAFYGMDDISSLAASTMTQANAQQIAQTFLNSHFPQPQKLTLLKESASNNGESFDTSYDFFFCQDLGNGVRGPAACEIEVDSIYGRIVRYDATNRPVLGPTVPSLTVDQAVAAALAAFAPNGDGQVRNVEGVGLTRPDAFGNETLAYSVVLSRPSIKVSVDGLTGRILDHMELLAISKPDLKATQRARTVHFPLTKRLTFLLVSEGDNQPHLTNRPPVRLEEQAYLAADYLRCGDRAAKVTWAADHKSYSLVTPRHQLAFTIGQKQYTLDGNKQTLKHSPAVVLDQPYVPLELAEKLMPYHLTYLAATKTVHFEPIANNTASTAPAVVPISAH